MNDRRLTFDVVVIGAGPAGLAAAVTAARAERHVALVESSPWIGGQIWRHLSMESTPRAGRRWIDRLRSSSVRVFTETSIFDSADPGCLLAETQDGLVRIHADKLILAVGAMEQFIPFPGWTLPNVYGAGGLQLLAKHGWPVAGKRVAVAGSGPLLFAVAAQLHRWGARIVQIAEQTSLGKVIGFGLRLPVLGPSKLWQAAHYQSRLWRVPYRTSCRPVRAKGTTRLESVYFRSGKRSWSVNCDMLACAFGLVPNLVLPKLLGCHTEKGAVVVDQWQETSVKNVYCAGEPTGIGGVDQAVVEGMIAAYTACACPSAAQKLFYRRARTQWFTRAMAGAFALGEELKDLVTPDTVICRCEDITAGQLQSFDSFRAAKLHTRCGMGACQGRNCGTAAAFLYGWENDSARPPAFPCRLGTLLETSS